MTIAKNEPVRINYPKHWFLLIAVAVESVVIWLFYGALGYPEGAWRTVWLIISPVIGAIAFLLMVPPLFTHHLAGERGLRLKMGLLLDETVPYAWIRDVKETSVSNGGIRVGIGVRYFPITEVLFVTSSFNNLARISLDREHTMGRFLKRPVREIILSVNYLSGFFEIVRAKKGPPGSG